LWRGPVLADLGTRLGQHPAAVALARRRVGAALAYADLAIDAGGYEQVAVHLRALAQDEPLHEGLHARLMLALAGCGEQAAALHLYAGIRGRLAEELGIEPGAELQAAHLRVLRQQVPIAGVPGPRAPDRPAEPGRPAPARLPPDLPDFTGRSDRLRDLDALVAGGDSAVVLAAIGGPAGVGKTALVVRWAHRVRDRFPDGRLYLNLHGLWPIEALARALDALGVPAGQVPTEVEEAAGLYRSLLADRRTLVILDDATSADQVRPLLPGTPSCLVLVTGRDILGGLVAREGARPLVLDPLSPADARSLLERALGAGRVAAEPGAVDEVARLCGYLPLALRIAAAHLAARPLAGYVDRLPDAGTAPRRVFDVSYAALPASARRMLRLLALVPGPDVTAAAAAALAGTTAAEAARLLGVLADGHLVERRPGDRFVLHDLLRGYAADRATAEDGPAGRDEALRRLFDGYLGGVDEAAALLYPRLVRLPIPAPRPGFADAAGAGAWLDAERANLVAAIRHAAERGPRPVAWLLADALRGHFRARLDPAGWLAVAEAALAAATAADDPAAMAAGRVGLAALHTRQGRQRQAIDEYERALALARQAGWADGEAPVLADLGACYDVLGQPQRAVEYARRSLEINLRTGRTGAQARNLVDLGSTYRRMGRLAEAADHYARALALRDRASTLADLGVTHHLLGRLDVALEQLTDALGRSRRDGDRAAEARVLRAVAEVHLDAGRHAQALELAETALRGAQEAGAPAAEALNTLGAVRCRLGRHGQAAELHQQALGAAHECGDRYAEVQALVGLACAQRRLEQPTAALAHANQALALARQGGFRMLEGQALSAVAEVHLDAGRLELAAAVAREALAVHRQTGHRLGAVRAQPIVDTATTRK
jgi:tetratricopeptide (TPR) repeat protein